MLIQSDPFGCFSCVRKYSILLRTAPGFIDLYLKYGFAASDLSTCGKNSDFSESSSYTAGKLFIFKKCLLLILHKFRFADMDFDIPEQPSSEGK